MLGHECCIKIHAVAPWYSLEGSQEDPPVHSGNQDLRHSLCCRLRDRAGWIHRFRLGGWFYWSKVNFRMCIHVWWWPYFLVKQKQAATALYSAKAEYRGAVNACIQAVWLQGILSEFDLGSTLSTNLFCDNQSAIKISTDPVTRKRTKHV